MQHLNPLNERAPYKRGGGVLVNFRGDNFCEKSGGVMPFVYSTTATLNFRHLRVIQAS